MIVACQMACWESIACLARNFNRGVFCVVRSLIVGWFWCLCCGGSLAPSYTASESFSAFSQAPGPEAARVRRKSLFPRVSPRACSVFILPFTDRPGSPLANPALAG